MARRDASRGDVILAAGGLVWRTSSRGREVALVHRPKYDDWTLPKGKLNDDETWQDCAVREVREETGLEVRLGEFGGGCAYLTKRAPKIVLYWNMEVEGETRFAGENAEVDALEWLSPEDARRRLTHRRDRRVLLESITNRGAGRRRRRRSGEEAPS